MHWKAQGDLEEPLEEALEEDVGSLEGDFNSDFVHDLEVGKIANMLILTAVFSFLLLNFQIHFYTDQGKKSYPIF